MINSTRFFIGVGNPLFLYGWIKDLPSRFLLSPKPKPNLLYSHSQSFRSPMIPNLCPEIPNLCPASTSLFQTHMC
ncbi:hypothetical protein ZOSMA_17G00050 [Zostera marina]|uniref:Uncharacterized protein n=1 Tax=Zostera marina TaxID=29655 RepID=A0A0K9PT82_ZOSMR|nr:hypothetical protein ZOSMA_17G00050 [Zostera marina]